jgi:hypothetical protein
MEVLRCWRCGASLADLTPPIERRDECPACRAQLYVCRFCEFYDPRVAKQCREPVADDVKEKERANFCGYFQPNSQAYVPADTSTANRAKAVLDALFGGGEATSPSSSSARDELEALFGKKK